MSLAYLGIQRTGSLTELGSGLSSHDLLRASQDRALYLRKSGILAGHRVALFQGSTLSFWVDLLALWEIGAAVMPLDPKMPPLVRERLLREACIAHCIEREKISSFSPTIFSLEECLLLYTSGSTGTPRAVVHTWASLSARLSTLKKNIPAREMENTLCLLPLHFGHGLIGNSLFPLVNGAHLYLAQPSQEKNLLRLGELLDRYKISFFSSVPSIWRYLSRFEVESPRTQSLRRIHCASEPVSLPLLEEISAWSGIKNIWNIYGLTELGSWAGGHCLTDTPPCNGFVGRLWDAETRIVDEKGAELEAGKLGTIEIRSPALFQGYWQNGGLTSPQASVSWFSTGDQGQKSTSGDLILAGRKQNIINCSGLKISPEELEALLSEAPGIADIAIFPVDNEISGQSIGAAVVWSSENAPGEIKNWCREYLPNYQIPHRWFTLEEIPRTPRGKIDRRQLLEKFGSRP